MHHKSRTFLACCFAAAMLSVGVVLGLPACGSGSPDAGQAQALSVSAASSLKTVMTELGVAFDAVNGTETSFNFEASGTLQTQIEAGAPVDVFASAAVKQVDALKDEDLVDIASIKVFAGNEIVLIVPADSALKIASFEDLAGARVRRVTYGDPAAAPHGVAAEEILNALSLFNEVKPKVIYAANVTQTLEYVIRGEVDAGIVFSTEAAVAGSGVKVAAMSKPDWHGVIAYPAAVVSSSANKALAQAFVDFLVGPDGQAILQQHGFLPTPAE